MGIFLVPRKRRDRTMSFGHNKLSDEEGDACNVVQPTAARLCSEEWREIVERGSQNPEFVPIPDAVGVQCFSDFLGWTELVVVQSVSKQFKGWALAALRETSHLLIRDVVGTIADNNLRNFLKKTSSNLSQVTLTRCPKFGDQFASIIAECCPQLSKFSTEDCPTITAQGFATILSRCHSLKSVHVESCGAAVTDEVLYKINDLHCHLDAVTIRHSPSLTKNGVAFLGLKTRMSLRTVDFTGCPGVDDQAIEMLARVCTNLERVSLGEHNRISDNSMYAIARFVGKSLRVLRLENCRSITDYGLRALSSSCVQLRKLFLIGMSEVRDDGVCALVSSNPELIEVSLSNSTRVGDMSVAAIATKVKALRRLDCKSLNLRNLTVEKIANSFGNSLTHLSLRSNSLIDDVSVSLVATLCLRLVHLDLYCCTGITSDGVNTIASHLKQLEFLDISWCYQVRAEEFLAVVQNCQKLRCLRAVGCDEVAYMAQSYVVKSRACQRDLIQLKEVTIASVPLVDHGTVKGAEHSKKKQSDSKTSSKITERRHSRGNMRSRSKSLYSQMEGLPAPILLGSTASAHAFPASRPPLKSLQFTSDESSYARNLSGKALLSPTMLSRKSVTGTWKSFAAQPHVRTVDSASLVFPEPRMSRGGSVSGQDTNMHHANTMGPHMHLSNNTGPQSGMSVDHRDGMQSDTGINSRGRKYTGSRIRGFGNSDPRIERTTSLGDVIHGTPSIRRHTSSPNVLARTRTGSLVSRKLSIDSHRPESPFSPECDSPTLSQRRLFGTSEKDIQRVRAFSHVETPTSTSSATTHFWDYE